MLDKKKLDDIVWSIEDFFYPVLRTYDNVRYWFKYRTTTKHHVVNTGLKPGWHDTDTRILNANFQMLCDYVEVELAWIYYVFRCEEGLKHPTPWYKRPFAQFRSKELGIKSLELDINEGEHEGSKKILKLYKWWTEERPNRPDPWKRVDKLYEKEDLMFPFIKKECKEDGTVEFVMKEQSPQLKRAIKAAAIKENQQYEEDTKMLIKLMKIRSSLWT
jgi:hypothetical protein